MNKLQITHVKNVQYCADLGALLSMVSKEVVQSHDERFASSQVHDLSASDIAASYFFTAANVNAAVGQFMKNYIKLWDTTGQTINTNDFGKAARVVSSKRYL